MSPTMPSSPAAARGTWVGTENPLLEVEDGGGAEVAPVDCLHQHSLQNTYEGEIILPLVDSSWY